MYVLMPTIHDSSLKRVGRGGSSVEIIVPLHEAPRTDYDDLPP